MFFSLIADSNYHLAVLKSFASIQIYFILIFTSFLYIPGGQSCNVRQTKLEKQQLYQAGSHLYIWFVFYVSLPNEIKLFLFYIFFFDISLLQKIITNMRRLIGKFVFSLNFQILTQINNTFNDGCLKIHFHLHKYLKFFFSRLREITNEN